MKIGRLLDDVLGSKSKIRILRVLARADELTGRDLARRAGISAASAHAAAMALSRLGIVRYQRKGSGIVYSMHSSHHLVGTAGLGLLLSEEEGYLHTAAFELVRKIKTGWIESLVLFGSAARGEAGLSSDIDICVLCGDSCRVTEVKQELLKRIPAIRDRFGLRVSPYVSGVGEFLDRYDKGEKLIRNIVREGVVVSGKPLSEVLSHERA